MVDGVHGDLRRPGATARLLLALALVLFTASGLLAGPDAAKHWVCPPCGIPCDNAVYDKPGTCPTCGMALVEQSEATAASAVARKKVALLVFTGVEVIDFTGPYEIFGAAGFDTYTVGETKEPVTSAMGLTVVPKYGFADAPPPDVLVVPGGGIQAALRNEAIAKWIRDTSARASITMSVCNGAFLLANAGLLDGLTATTTSGRIDQLRAEYPKVRVVDDKRFVDNGKIITTAGLSSGIDGALHVVERIDGEGQAQQTALGEEYDWRPRSEFARASLADRNIPDVGDDLLHDWKIVKTEGGTDHWTMAAQGPSDLSAQQISERLGAELERQRWKRAGSGASSSASEWTFTGRDGKPWRGKLAVAPVAGEKNHYVASLIIARTKG
jgi:putative intracellular protease/amidase